MGRKIILLPHDQNWSALYTREAEIIAETLGAQVVVIHHFGSTAIPGIKAKPTIDILVEVLDIEKIDQDNERLEALGYQPMGEFGIPGRRFFRKEVNGFRTYHLHIYQVGNPEIDRHLSFRDYLISHPEEAQEYSALKEALAVKFPDDTERYVEGKTEFCRRIEAIARHQRLTNMG